MPPEQFRVGLVQMSCGPEPEENLDKALQRVAEAAQRGANVVCLPELFQTQYFCQREDHSLFDLAETIPGQSTEKLAAAARRNNIVLIASLFEKRAPGVYHNTAALFEKDGSLRGIYRKMHIPDDPLYYEKFYFTPGDLGFRALDTSAGRLGTLVCWDQWYPEGARLTALQGANVLFYPTAIGWHPAEKTEFGVAQHDAWRTIQRAMTEPETLARFTASSPRRALCSALLEEASAIADRGSGCRPQEASRKGRPQPRKP